jgi:Domain of unknown function (DUF5668)
MKNKEIYVGFTFLILGLLFFLYQYNPLSFFKVIKYWPIFILIAGILMEFIVISSTNQILFLFLSGIFMVYGIMYTINIYQPFNYLCTHIAVLLLSLSASLLNYYIFYKKSDFILPFILMLILVSIFTFLFPIYEIYFPVIDAETIIPIVFIILGIIIIFKGFIKIN